MQVYSYLNDITANTAELSLLEGVTATTAEFNLLDVSTATNASEATFLRGDGAWEQPPTSGLSIFFWLSS